MAHSWSRKNGTQTSRKIYGVSGHPAFIMLPIMHWYFNPEWWLFILGVPTLIFVAWQTVATANASKAALSNSRIVEIAQRAWITAELTIPDTSAPHISEGVEWFPDRQRTEQTNIFDIKLACRNVGKSPAWIDHIYAQMDIVDSTSVAADLILRKKDFGSMGILAAGEEQSRNLDLQCIGRKKSHEFLSICVLIEYRDIFHSTHETQIGYSFRNRSLRRQDGLTGRNRNT